MKALFGPSLFYVLVFAAPVTVLAQGSLTPPGQPAPTMKTLDQIEPRTPISALPFSISSPGSYYLTGNLTATADGASITVSADDVMIDLNGFTLAAGSTAGHRDFRGSPNHHHRGMQ